MRIHLIAVGSRLPRWVETGYAEYVNRLPPECRLQLTEIPAARRGQRSAVARAQHSESERLLAAVPAKARVIALAEQGTHWDTRELAGQLAAWLRDGRDVALLVGGPEGLTPACRARAEQHWSLSRLTFPHPLVRIIVAEQIYRAWSLLQHHPYHRA